MFQEVERFKFIKSEKMKKDVSGGGEVQVHKIRKNDEKRRFTRSKVKVQKIRKNDEKRRFRRLKVKIQKILKKR
jgi:hypothetical protein